MLALAFAASAAFAGRPLSTEDASVLEEGRCQVESWVDRSRASTTGWIAPACNLGANIEWQAGFARTRDSDGSRHSDAYAQAKTVFREIGENSPWGVGLVLGAVRGGHPYVFVPISISLGEVLLHGGAGWSRDSSERNLTTWGVALEVPATARLTWVGEAYGENSERPFVRFGARYGLVKDVLDVDLTVVARPGGTRDERFVSLGVFWQSGKFLK